MRILELFGGIGACTKALKKINVPVEIVDYVEIDKYAVASYNAINGTNFKPQDITTWDKNIDVDLIMHGSPCQDFSIAGRQAGGDQGTATRSSLMWETVRIVTKLKPKYVIWENVKNVLSAKHKHNFDAYIEKMRELGYTSYYQVMNAKDYGVPQNRERIFIVSILGESNFTFPEKQPLKLHLKDVLQDDVDEKYYLPDEIAETFMPANENGNVIGKLNMDKWQDHMKRIYDVNKFAPTISTYQGGWLEPKIIIDGGKIRKLTPKECWRLMAFDDEDFEKAANVNSNSQLYKQAGNSIVVSCLCNIFKRLLQEVEQVKQIEKTIRYDTDRMIDLAKLQEQEPELFEELLADYPVEPNTTLIFNVKEKAA
jgi:DNA (cytosine-5)-methyltransferase 1